MINVSIPENERERLNAVRSLAILDTPAEERFDRITKLAISLFGVPISTLTIMDEDREWFKSCQGVETHESPRVISFCGHVIASSDEMLIVSDTKTDPRFFDNPMVVGPPFIRFYAGVPIFSLSGERIGVFCIKDTKPRELNESERYLLQTLTSWAELEVNFVAINKLLEGRGDKKRLTPLLQRLSDRRVKEHLSSIKFGLVRTREDPDGTGVAHRREVIEYIERLITALQKYAQG